MTGCAQLPGFLSKEGLWPASPQSRAGAVPHELIKTDRLLRPWRPEDLAEFSRLLTDPVVTRYIVVHTPFSPADVAELSARTAGQVNRR